MKKILIVAGDPSGDLIASQLVEAMRRVMPDIHVTALGGDNLKRVSDRFVQDLVKEHAMGFAISPTKLLRFHSILKNVIEPLIKKDGIDVVVPVDFYGFNCRVAKIAKLAGRKVFYYISPQFWASRPGRANRLRPFVDLFLCLFPFEIDFYEKKGIPAQFVGHPLVDALARLTNTPRPPLKVEATIGLLPGSRPDEIRRHLPVLREACRRIKTEYPSCRFVLFTVPHVSKDLYKEILVTNDSFPLLVDMVQDDNYMWRSQLDLAMTASGMETLENALLGIPMVVLYKMNYFTFGIAKCLIKTKYVSLPNILSQKELVPEFLQWQATPKAIADPILNWLKNPKELQSVRAELLALKDKFGRSGAVERAARAILEKVA